MHTGNTRPTSIHIASAVTPIHCSLISFKLDYHLSRDTVATAFHLLEFCERGYGNNVPADIRQICIAITVQHKYYPPPENRQEEVQSTRSTRRATKHPAPDPKTDRYSNVWANWLIDKTELIPITATFRKETKELRERLNIEHPSPPQARNSTNTNMSSQGDKDRDDPPGETPRRLNNLENMMTILMAKIDKLTASTGNQTEKETESSGRQGTSQPLPLANKVEVTRKIKPEDISYFNPDNTADTSKDKGKTVVYRNIYEFINRIKITVLQ